jgi:hypothetical protein
MGSPTLKYSLTYKLPPPGPGLGILLWPPPPPAAWSLETHRHPMEKSLKNWSISVVWRIPPVTINLRDGKKVLRHYRYYMSALTDYKPGKHMYYKSKTKQLSLYKTYLQCGRTVGKMVD